MGRSLFYSGICFVIWLSVNAQSPPFVLSHTVIPQPATTSVPIKIVTKVLSPNQATEVDKTYSVSPGAMKVFVHHCYAGSMLPATQTFVDTFSIGQLPPGVYSLEHKVYLSAAQQWCNKTDSVMTTGTFTINAVTSAQEQVADAYPEVFPNPVSDMLHVRRSSGFKEVFIYSTTGALLKRDNLNEAGSIPVSELPDGVYVLKLIGDRNSNTLRFIKNSN